MAWPRLAFDPRACSRWESLELGKMCVSPNHKQAQGPDHSVWLWSLKTPLCIHTSKVTRKDCSYCLSAGSGWQFLQEEHISAIFKVNGLTFLLKGNFYKSQGLMNFLSKLCLLLAKAAKGALDCLPCHVTIPSCTESRAAGPTSLVTCPRPKHQQRWKVDPAWMLMPFRLYATSYHFLTILK